MFPHSIRSLHYRRCVLGESTHVAIAVTDSELDGEEITFQQNYIQGLRKFFSAFFAVVHDVMSVIFSDRNSFGCPRKGNGYFAVLPVLTDPGSGGKYFIFRFRRYNLAGDRFLPGSLNNLNYLKDITSADRTNGLSSAEVKARRQIVGENHISIPKPWFPRCIQKEFSKPFYTYQLFMIWVVSEKYCSCSFVESVHFALSTLPGIFGNYSGFPCGITTWRSPGAF